ncbi:nitrobenzoate reductase [Candidimonas nitroreducens]|uniref:Nitrobenzoate reductase n=2 Tax=Candidimonas nitroreducens TaxID=683354 RepID=A0A225MS48_9BURK|nr:nitrobenzoate reductase [Candidimonas nitroreducens]
MQSDKRQTIVDAVIESRSSIRAFTAQEVPKDEIMQILRVASRAPSGTNCQPWKVYVLRGKNRADLVDKICRVHDQIYADSLIGAKYLEEYDYYPRKWFEPYLARRRQNGYALYALLGIEKGDKARMHAQHQRNFRFFDAPIGMIFTIDRNLGHGSLVDCGMFLQNLMLAAKSRGIDTCPQAAWNHFGRIILPHVGAGPNEMLLCGMAIGYANGNAPENSLLTPRVPPESFTTFLD